MVYVRVCVRVCVAENQLNNIITDKSKTKNMSGGDLYSGGQTERRLCTKTGNIRAETACRGLDAGQAFKCCCLIPYSTRRNPRHNDDDER